MDCKKKEKETQEHRYGDFQVHLWIIPYSDYKLCQLMLVAVSLTDINNTVDSHHAKEVEAIPVF